MSNLLEAQQIYKRYATHTALSGVSLAIEQGSIFGLLGPNGAGKTTFIRILNQIIQPDSGQILFQGNTLTRKHIEQIGYLPEERGLYKAMSVSEQVLYLAQLKGLTLQRAKEQLDFWFKRLDILHWKNKKVQELSKGMAQKVQFVVTVIHQPKLLIFDEVFSGLDPINAQIIKDEVLYLKAQGATIIFSTHRMESVEQMCDAIALFNLSEKILEGKLTDIKQQFKTHTYQVGLENVSDTLIAQLSEKFELWPTDFKSAEASVKLNIRIAGATPNELLQLLISQAQVTHFTEIIPSVDDIFIQAVKSHQCKN